MMSCLPAGPARAAGRFGSPSLRVWCAGLAMTSGAFGVKWQGGRITTSVKSTNIFNRTIQQHVFGDLIRRSVVGELKFRL